ncbi:MAG: phytoene/squalene synthase family protein [Candidatus Nanopelagicaceae bacterium]|nr:phytoene/squalene synthase family protein [Candidatus Nanopelagicaceae bacterium]
MDELTSASILDPVLRASYEECKRLNAMHGKTYYLATLLLPKSKRPFVHALYGFARHADEIVDDLASRLDPLEKAEQLKSWSRPILESLISGESQDPVGRALIDTAIRFSIPVEYFESFLHSMAMDLSIVEYETFDQLMEYMYGSAAVIGLEMAQVLGARAPDALEAAKKLGIAFQLANFIRDVSEDLDRGRIYLPLEELEKSGVDRAMLEERVLTPEIVEALKYQITRVRDLQGEANAGISLLPRESRPCIRAASEMYCGIVDAVEANGYDIFNSRAQVSVSRKAKVMFQSYAAKVFIR